MDAGRLLVTNTSAPTHSRSSARRPLSFFTSSAMLRLLRLAWSDIAPMPGLRIGAANRMMSPSGGSTLDRKSTRLNSRHGYISYAVFCLKEQAAAVATGRLDFSFSDWLPPAPCDGPP